MIKGSKMSAESKLKMSLASKGRPKSEAHKKKISESHTGEKSYAWKGDKVTYTTLHNWVIKWKGHPLICENCGRNDCRIEWANKDHSYKRILEDFISLCIYCHLKYDKENGLR